ncbi:hypothetical protein [Haloechinothrix sp. LS1_15]|uniref:hypothetical protein n=1 Tax=Haloechinothrix sp. LS1_15 TaxID=2652248 RepID=UPI002944BF40|nr:hypothetical protein [Haloechinothrix sp. LS1_15]MDV6012566.1 hypothetical protein [Haloechinothrix sp. LS1_15]
MPAQDGTGNPDLPLPAIDENPTPGIPAGGELRYANQLRTNADAKVSGQLEDIAFDEDGVNKVITRLLELYDKLDQHRERDSYALESIFERDDPVSSNYAFAANRGGKAYIEALENELDDLKKLIEDVERIRDERLWQEEQHVEVIERQA